MSGRDTKKNNYKFTKIKHAQYKYNVRPIVERYMR